jgi:hypothetical protein
MNENIVINDLSRFGRMELFQASELLRLWSENRKDKELEFVGEVSLNINTITGNVFLCDEEFQVGVIEDGFIVQYYSCPNCGNEGTQAEGLDEGWDFKKYSGCCSKKCLEA